MARRELLSEKEEGAELVGMLVALEKQKRERPDAHRAFLLWAMQDPNKRVLRRAAVAMDLNESTVRSWQRRNKWKDRIAAFEAPDSHAIEVYRRMYLADFGEVDLPQIADRMRVPVSSGASAGKRMTKAEAKRHQDHQAKVEEYTRAQARRDQQKMVGELSKLAEKAVEASLEPEKKNGSKGRLKRIDLSARDILLIMETQVALADGGEQATGVMLEDTVRVAQVKDAGGDELAVVRAMQVDVQELTLILSGLAGGLAAEMNAAAPDLSKIGEGDEEEAPELAEA